MSRHISMYSLLAVTVCLAAAASGSSLPYIIGGRDAKVGEFPWQASFTLSGEHYCGASLVTSKWLIAAAHCMPNWYNEDASVVLGAHDIKTRIQGKPTVHAIEKVIVHANASDSYYDIALIKLKKPADIDGSYIATIKPAPADVGDLVGANCTITGWGMTRADPPTEFANILQAVATTPIPKAGSGSDKCERDSIICVGAKGKEGACYGDSGGPLSCTMDDGSLVLAGELWGGSTACLPSYPTIYTRISSYRQWLADNSDGDIPVDL